MARRPTGKRVKTAGGVVVSKNANGDGSIYAVGDRYKATYRHPTTGNRHTVSGKTKGEAAERRTAKLAELAADRPTGRLGPDPTVADLAAYWLTHIAAVQVRPATLHTYTKDVRRITDSIGDEKVADLDTEVVRTWLADLRRQGLAASTVRNARTRLRQVVQSAVELGYLSANPVAAVSAPKATAEDRRKARSLTPAETRRLVGALDGTRRYDAAIAMLFTSGNRVSEVLGLAWSDLDLDAGTATIRRGSTYTGGGVGARLDRPKTAATAGVHHLAPVVVALLRQRRTAQVAERLAAGPAWPTITYKGEVLEMVFTATTGELAVRQHVAAALTAACERAKIDPTGVATHTGRRSAITALYVGGVPLDDVARHVGHASPETTAGYVTDLGTRPQDTAALAARLLDPTAGDA